MSTVKASTTMHQVSKSYRTEAYEATVEDGKFIYKLSRKLIDTRVGPTNAKWIFVLSTSSILYVGMKRKGKFQHSSFLAGGATLSAGRLVIIDGILKKSPDHEEDVPDEKVTGYEMRNCVSEPDFSRAKEETEHKHYNNKDSKPPRFSRNSKPKITSLEIPKKEDIILAFKKNEPQTKLNPETESASSSDNDDEIADELLSSIKLMVSKRNLFDFGEEACVDPIPQEKIMNRINSHKEKKSFQLAKHLSCQWSTGAGPRIGCVRDYPSEIQLQALEEVCSSGRMNCRNGGSRDRSDRRRKSYSMDNVSFFNIEPP